jgi:hypothetical protein
MEKTAVRPPSGTDAPAKPSAWPTHCPDTTDRAFKASPSGGASPGLDRSRVVPTCVSNQEGGWRFSAPKNERRPGSTKAKSTPTSSETLDTERSFRDDLSGPPEASYGRAQTITVAGRISWQDGPEAEARLVRQGEAIRAVLVAAGLLPEAAGTGD